MIKPIIKFRGSAKPGGKRKVYVLDDALNVFEAQTALELGCLSDEDANTLRAQIAKKKKEPAQGRGESGAAK